MPGGRTGLQSLLACTKVTSSQGFKLSSIPGIITVTGKSYPVVLSVVNPLPMTGHCVILIPGLLASLIMNGTTEVKTGTMTRVAVT